MSAPRTFMFIAGETSGDRLAAELVEALRSECSGSSPTSASSQTQAPTQAPVGTAAPVFFGAGGPNLARAGVSLTFDLTRHAVIGLWDVLIHLVKFRRLMDALVTLALERRPDVIVCVDFSGFNSRLGRAIRRRQAEAPGWKPALVQFVSPQVWASRPGRAAKMARDFDLLLSIFPFEKAWYAQHAPAMRVEFVGHPMLDRHAAARASPRPDDPPRPLPTVAIQPNPNTSRTVLLLPGSRVGELRRHLPVMTAAAQLLRESHATDFLLVVPNEELLPLARELTIGLDGLQIQIGELAAALPQCTIALASTGTVTMECAFFGVPTITLYKTNWFTYEIGRRIVTVQSLTMPNLLAGEPVYPEFIQHEATAQNLATAARELLDSPERRARIQEKLATIIRSLGEPGACRRAAALICSGPTAR